MVNCTFSDESLKPNVTDQLVLARGYTAVCTLAISLLVFIAALCNLARKYIRFHREAICFCRFFVDYFTNPFLLLAFVSLLPLGAYWIILLKYHRIGDNNTLGEGDFCKLVGYLLLWFESSETLALAVFSLYFLFFFIPNHSKKSGLFTSREYEDITKKKPFFGTVQAGNEDEPPEYKARVPKVAKRYWAYSALYVVTAATVVIVCGLYTCPYIVGLTGPKGGGGGVEDGGKYEYTLEGPWCWISPKIAQKHFWFFEEWMYMGVSLVSLVLSFFILLCVTRSRGAKLRVCRWIKWDKTIMIPFSIFFFYFLVQFGLMAVEFLIRVCSNSNRALWFTYAIGKPLSKILLVVASLQMMSTSYRMGDKPKPSVTARRRRNARERGEVGEVGERRSLLLEDNSDSSEEST